MTSKLKKWLLNFGGNIPSRQPALLKNDQLLPKANMTKQT